MKNIQLNETKKISALQAEFNKIFPYLKLEFFHHRHKTFAGSPKKDMLDTSLTLKQCMKKHTPNHLVLTGNMKVSELEELFFKTYGLSAQVFRKSGKSWIETTVTDDWTLEYQNNEGKELSYLAK
jgi:hypothetical protein